MASYFYIPISKSKYFWNERKLVNIIFIYPDLKLSGGWTNALQDTMKTVKLSSGRLLDKTGHA